MVPSRELRSSDFGRRAGNRTGMPYAPRRQWLEWRRRRVIVVRYPQWYPERYQNRDSFIAYDRTVTRRAITDRVGLVS